MTRGGRRLDPIRCLGVERLLAVRGFARVDVTVKAFASGELRVPMTSYYTNEVLNTTQIRPVTNEHRKPAQPPSTEPLHAPLPLELLAVPNASGSQQPATREICRRSVVQVAHVV